MKRIISRTFILAIAGALLASVHHAAAAEAPTVQVLEYSKKRAVKSVTESLPWSKQGLKDAQKQINKQKALVESTLDDLKQAGVVDVYVRYGSASENPVNAYLGSADKLRSYTIRAVMPSSKITEQGPFPEDPMVLANYLVKLKDKHCHLGGWSLLEPATWNTPECSVVTPKPKTYLRYSLIPMLSYAELGDVHMYNIGLLQWILDSGVPYSIEGNRVVSQDLLQISTVDGIDLNWSDDVGGYKISPSADGGFIYEKTGPSVAEMAKRAHFSKKFGVIRFD